MCQVFKSKKKILFSIIAIIACIALVIAAFFLFIKPKSSDITSGEAGTLLNIYESTTLGGLKTKFNNATTDDDKNKAKQEIVNYFYDLQRKHIISNVVVNQDEIYFNFIGIQNMFSLVNDNSTGDVRYRDLRTITSATNIQPLHYQQNAISYNKNDSLSENNIGNNNVLILSSFPKYSPQDENYGYIEDYISLQNTFLDSQNYNFNVNVTYKENATVNDYISNLDRYGIILINSHGYCWNNDYPVIELQEETSISNVIKYSYGLYHGLINLCGGIGIIGADYCITPQFISFYYEYSLPNSLIYVGACDGFANDKLCNAFITAGASVYTGFSDKVQVIHNGNIISSYMEDLFQGKTAEEAYNYTIDKNGNYDGVRNTYFKIGGNENLKIINNVESIENATVPSTNTASSNIQTVPPNVTMPPTQPTQNTTSNNTPAPNQTQPPQQTATTQPPQTTIETQIPYPINTYGNTSGNITNRGLVAIQGDWIYYSNGSDIGKLYKIKTDGTGKQKLNDDYSSQYINVIGNNIYYSGTNSNLYTINIDGSGRKKLNNDYTEYIYVIGDKIYYKNYSSNGSAIYSIKTDGTDRKSLSNDSPDCLSIMGDRIYYRNNSDNCKLYSIKTDGTDKQKLNDDITCEINVVNDEIFYRNNSDNDKIYKIKTDGTDRQKVSDDTDGSAFLNVVGDMIYYSHSWGDNGTYSIKTDGTENKKLSDDYAWYINVVGDQIYYQKGSMYTMKTDGTDKKIVD